MVGMETDRNLRLDGTFDRKWHWPRGLHLQPELCTALVEAFRQADEIRDRRTGHPPGGIVLRGQLGTGK